MSRYDIDWFYHLIKGSTLKRSSVWKICECLLFIGNAFHRGKEKRWTNIKYKLA
jgi:hypothetical protein